MSRFGHRGGSHDPDVQRCVPANRSTFDGLVKATIIVGAIVAAVLITMTIAGANVVRPVQLVADGSEPPELVAHELHLERGGTLSGYQILY